MRPIQSSQNSFHGNNSTYELSNSDANPEKDLLISQLKTEIFEKEQNEKNFNLLQSKFRNLQNDLQLLSEEKVRLEYELKSKTENGSKAIGDLKSENENLLNELNEKIAMNKKLYNDNNNLFRNLESRTMDNQGIQDQMREQEDVIAKLSEEKGNAERKILTLNQTREQHINNIRDLNNEIDKLNHLTQEQIRVIKNKTEQIEDTLKNLEAQKFENKNLIGKLQSREENLGITQRQLEMANQTIEKMDNDFNSLNNNFNSTQNNLNMVTNNLNKENSLRIQAEKNNEKLEAMLEDRNQEIKKISNENDSLKMDLDKMNQEKDQIGGELERYKRHLMVLTEENEKLAKELESILDRDMQLLMTLGRTEKLGFVIDQNRQILENSLDSLRNYMDRNSNDNPKRTYETTVSQNSTYAGTKGFGIRK